MANVTGKRIRWNKGNVESAIRAAGKLARSGGRPRYVYATAHGFTITDDVRIARWQSYTEVEASGKVVAWIYKPAEGCHERVDIGAF